MEEKDQKIADLEVKLEQSQKEKELDNAFWKQECDSLQKALAEKEKEIEEINKEFVQSTHDWKDLVKEKTQDKISFAIEQLEKVYEYAADVWWVDGVSEVVCNFINQQIKELKEKTNVKD